MTMNRIPQKRKRARMGVKVSSVVRSPGHLAYIRTLECAVRKPGYYDCNLHDGCNKVEAAHVRTGTDGGTSIKPGDNWAMPLCAAHHRQQHQIGEPEFERRYGVDMKAIAKALWQADTYHRGRWEEKQRENAA